jgi:hypothetical protein
VPYTELSMLQSMLVRREVLIVTLREPRSAPKMLSRPHSISLIAFNFVLTKLALKAGLRRALAVSTNHTFDQGRAHGTRAARRFNQAKSRS